MGEVILYAINCPRCHVLKEKLDLAGIKYRVVTNTNVLREKGVTHLPVLEVGGKMLGFAEAMLAMKGGELK